MNYLQFIQELSKSELVVGIGALIAALLALAGALEKLFGWKSVGTMFCSFVWKLVKYFWGWLRNDQFRHIKEQLDIIQKEVTPNGGGSMKDVVESLKLQGDERWTVLMALHDFTKELWIRMDLADEADNRMSFKLDSQKSCIYISENFLRFFGYTPNDVLGTNFEFCIDTKDRKSVRAKWKEAFDRRKPFSNEQILIDSDAKRHLCLVRGIPLEDREKSLTGFFGTVEILESLDD